MQHIGLADTVYTPEPSRQHQQTYVASNTAEVPTRVFILYLDVHDADVTGLISRAVTPMEALTEALTEAVLEQQRVPLPEKCSL